MKSYSQRRSQMQEKRAAVAVGGRVQPGSGSSPFAKSDVRAMGKLRVECKTTSKKVYQLKLSDLLKVRLEGIQGGLEGWVFQIEFQGKVGFNTRLAVLDEAWYLEMGGVYAADYVGTVVQERASVQIEHRLVSSDRPLLWVSKNVEHKFAICPWVNFLELYKKTNP
jgi:hypothetical protein